MILKITDKTKVDEVQRHFNKIYPNLRLEFYYPSANNGHAKVKMNPDDLLTRFSAINGQLVKEISIQGTETVAQLENDFKNQIQVEVQVLRRLGRIWVDISYTEDWTLSLQNAEADEMDRG